VWTTLRQHLEQRKAELVRHLILGGAVDDDWECRGRIKELNELLELPEKLQQEAQLLASPQQEEGEVL
jgi:hypothetical protein